MCPSLLFDGISLLYPSVIRCLMFDIPAGHGTVFCSCQTEVVDMVGHLKLRVVRDRPLWATATSEPSRRRLAWILQEASDPKSCCEKDHLKSIQIHFRNTQYSSHKTSTVVFLLSLVTQNIWTNSKVAYVGPEAALVASGRTPARLFCFFWVLKKVENSTTPKSRDDFWLLKWWFMMDFNLPKCKQHNFKTTIFWGPCDRLRLRPPLPLGRAHGGAAAGAKRSDFGSEKHVRFRWRIDQHHVCVTFFSVCLDDFFDLKLLTFDF